MKILLPLGILSISSLIHAQDFLEPLIVTAKTASRIEEDVKEIPANIIVVDSAEIARKQPSTPIQMLKEQPGIWAVDVNAQGSPILRGQIGNRVIYLWDGVRINNGALFGGPNGFFNQFPVGAVDRIEALLGSGSVQYGSDAIGGVVNVFSKQAGFTDTPKIGGSIFEQYNSNNHGNTSTLDFFSSGPKVSFSAGLTNQDIGSYRGPEFGKHSPSGFETQGGYVNLAFRPTENQLLRLSYLFNERSNVESYAQSKLNPVTGIPRFFSPYEERGILKLDYTLTDLAAWSSELKAYAYYQDYEASRERRSEASSGTILNNTISITEQSVLGYGLQNTKDFGSVRVTGGVDYRYEDLKSSQSLINRNLGTGATTQTVPNGLTPDGNYDVFDVFTQAKWDINDKLQLNAGVRFENSHLESSPEASDVIPNAGYTIADLQLDRSWQSFTWELGSIYQFTDEISIHSNIATGFRAPTFSDALSTGTPVFNSSIASLPSPDVDPEQSITYQLGPHYDSDRISASLTGFYTKLTDVITSNLTGETVVINSQTFNVTRNSNSGEGYLTGAELALQYRITDDWTLFGNGTYTYSKDYQANIPATNFTADDSLRFTPPLFGNLGLRYNSPTGKWWIEIVEVMSASLTRHALRDEGDAGFSTDPGLGSPNTTTNPPLRSDFSIPGFAVTNIRGGYNVWDDERGKFDLTLDINNVLNAGYREAYAQQQREAPGIGAVIGARLTF